MDFNNIFVKQIFSLHICRCTHKIAALFEMWLLNATVHWLSDHMISSRPLIGQPPPPAFKVSIWESPSEGTPSFCTTFIYITSKYILLSKLNIKLSKFPWFLRSGPPFLAGLEHVLTLHKGRFSSLNMRFEINDMTRKCIFRKNACVLIWN